MNSTETPYIAVPLGREAHAIAGQFAANQATQEKGKQVYLNTLAVYAVHSYLKWMEIETNLSQSDSWHPGLQPLSDVADLVLPGIGRLECRPVLPGEISVRIPPQATEDRIGYVAVQFSESLNEVQLLGFVRTVNASKQPQQIAITSLSFANANLQPLDVLLDYIPETSTSTVPVNLNRWFENIFEAGWQTVEALFSPQVANPALSVRNAHQLGEINTEDSAPGVKRGKLINLGIQLAGNPVALIVTVTPATDEEADIRLQVYPTGRQIYLPQGLQLSVLDENGAAVPALEATARSADNCIQLAFSVQPGEQFSVQLAFGDVSITEEFLL